MGHALGSIVNFAIPAALTATGHPELAAAYSGTKSYAETGDPLSALASAGTQYAGSQFAGNVGQLGAPSATDPLVSGINAGTQLATSAGEQTTLAGLEALKNNAMANSINPALGNSFGDTVRIASDAAAKDAMLNSGAPLFNPQAITPLTGGSVADAASSPILTSYPYAQQVNPLAAVNPATANLAPTTVPFDSLSMGDKLGAFGKGLGSLTSSSGRQALVDAYGGNALKAGLGAAAFASPVLTPLLTPEPMQAEEGYYGGPFESLESVRRRARGYAQGGIAALNPMMGVFDARNANREFGEQMGGYKKGGYLDGPGDGMSDSISATIEGKQPARLADGEFVIPADVVSHLGNGSTKAGAKRLYAMMDKVRKARTGTTKQGRQINPNKYMAA
jgi:hypothetical protein